MMVVGGAGTNFFGGFGFLGLEFFIWVSRMFGGKKIMMLQNQQFCVLFSIIFSLNRPFLFPPLELSSVIHSSFQSVFFQNLFSESSVFNSPPPRPTFLFTCPQNKKPFVLGFPRSTPLIFDWHFFSLPWFFPGFHSFFQREIRECVGHWDAENRFLLPVFELRKLITDKQVLNNLKMTLR